MMATSAFGTADTSFGPDTSFMNAQLASCLANGLGSLCGPATPATPSGPSISGSNRSSASSPSSSVDSLISDMVYVMNPASDEQDGKQPACCTSCDDGAVAVATCSKCNETLCDGCAQAHQRVSLTKTHVLDRIVPAVPAFISSSAGQVAHRAGAGLDANRAANERFLAECSSGALSIKERMDVTQQMVDTIETKANQLRGEIHRVARCYVAAVEQRERELLSRLDSVRVLKNKSLITQLEVLRGLLVRFSRLSDSLRDALQRGTSLDILHTKEKAAVELLQLRAARSNVVPGMLHEDDGLDFVSPDGGLLRAVATMGNLTCSGYALATTATGEGISRATKGLRAAFTVQLKNHLNEPVLNSAELLEAMLIGPDGSVLRCTLEDSRNGSQVMAYYPLTVGSHGLHVTLRGRHIRGSPFQVAVEASSLPDYSRIRHATLTFGSEGDSDGQFLRPWGICSDSRGRLIVADRSNNRIQIFDHEGKFITKFGKLGNKPSEFDRPAGVACDPNDRIVVADKDNHRIQIFNNNGDFLLKFGELGSKSGQFNYPWDVATNGKSQIVVSDTRNHRIQLFSPEGEFLLKYGYETYTAMWKHFDSPRGICFTNQGFVCVTDFNNHRLLVVDPEFRNARFLGVEGCGKKQFQRPQGVAVNSEDQILVADSKNNRIQVFCQEGLYVSEIGVPIDMDRPSGLCVTKDGRVAVVDFGHSRVMVF